LERDKEESAVWFYWRDGCCGFLESLLSLVEESLITVVLPRPMVRVETKGLMVFLLAVMGVATMQLVKWKRNDNYKGNFVFSTRR